MEIFQAQYPSRPLRVPGPWWLQVVIPVCVPKSSSYKDIVMWNKTLPTPRLPTVSYPRKALSTNVSHSLGVGLGLGGEFCGA